MKETYNEYKNILKDFLCNKFYIISIIIITILAYGFYITNYSIGVDDFSQDRYVTGTYLLSQGRWGNVLLARILNNTSFVPFWTEFLAIILLLSMSTILVTFIKKEIGNVVNKTIYYVLFSGTLITYPVIHHIFLYNLANVISVLSDMAMIIIAIVIYENVFNLKNEKVPIICCIIMPFFISMYEASCQTFLVFSFIISFIALCKNNENKKKILSYIVTIITMLAISILINIVISHIIMKILELNGKLMPDYSAKHMPWLNENIIECIRALKYRVINVYKNEVSNLCYIALFFITAIISVAISIVQSIKKKSLSYVILVSLAIMANFAINVIQIRVLYRTSTSWGIAIAFMLLYLLIYFRKLEFIRVILSLGIGFIILCNTRILTYLFYNEHIRYEREKNIAYDIANTIVRTCSDYNKPLIFVPYNEVNVQGNSINYDNGWPVIGWGLWAFGEPGMETIKFINSLGYNFNCATNEERQEGYKEFLKVEAEHKENFVIELDKYIIVKVVNEPRNI